MYLIIGLGNPGKEYEGTRHNIGREIVRALADDWRVQKKLHAEIARLNDDVLLALPTTYMNESGRAIKKLILNFKFQISNVLVVHDDIDLPVGTLRFSFGANSGGHRGIESIIQHMKTKEFARLRIGIAGKARMRTDAAMYVLKKFSLLEQKTQRHIKKEAIGAISYYVNHGLDAAMNRYN